jgi:hypothetical protein
MKVTDYEKKLIELFRKQESPRCREALLREAQTMVFAQNALKEDYGLVGVDAPLFNGQYALLPESRPAQTAGGRPAA